VRRAFIGVSAETVPVPRRHALAGGWRRRAAPCFGRRRARRAGSEGGLLRQDLVVALDGLPVTGVDDLIRLLDGDRIGRAVTVDVLRLGRPRSVTVTPVERSKSG
jgi:S1-C subfamily serine protease